MERICELVNIAANKNTVPGDSSALVPGGLRIGSPAMTSRGLVEGDFVKVVEFIHRAVVISKDIQKGVGSELSHFLFILVGFFFSLTLITFITRQEIQGFQRRRSRWFIVPGSCSVEEGCHRIR